MKEIIKELINYWMNEWSNQLMNEGVNEWMNEEGGNKHTHTLINFAILVIVCYEVLIYGGFTSLF